MFNVIEHIYKYKRKHLGQYPYFRKISHSYSTELASVVEIPHGSKRCHSIWCTKKFRIR